MATHTTSPANRHIGPSPAHINDANRVLASPEMNPFENHSVRHMTIKNRIKLALGAIFLLPIRLLLLLLSFLYITVFSNIAMAGFVRADPPVPVKARWRITAFKMARMGARFTLFSCGFVRIRVHGKPASTHDAPIIVVAPHSGLIDWCPVIWQTYASFVSADTNLKYPIISIGLRALQCILVSRRQKGSKKAAMDEIRRRAHSHGEWPPIMMFPEGTTTNRRCLVTFKAGAFVSGVPVQPVALQYHCDGFDPSWVTDGPGLFTLAFLMLSQWWGEMDMTYLPVVVPSEDEKRDPEAFARRVQVGMSQFLRVPHTQHTVEDMLLQLSAKKAGLPPSVGVVEFAKLHKNLGLTLDDVTKMLADFSRIVNNRKDGKVSLLDFCEYLSVAPTEEVRKLFEAYDSTGDDLLDFREYIVGMTLITARNHNETLLRDAFRLFDREGTGKVRLDTFKGILSGGLMLRGLDAPDSERISSSFVRDVNADRNGMVSYNEFAYLIKNKPQYADLLAMNLDGHGEGFPQSTGM